MMRQGKVWVSIRYLLFMFSILRISCENGSPDHVEGCRVSAILIWLLGGGIVDVERLVEELK